MDKQEFDFNVDLLKAILWQYNDATNIQSILEKKKAWYDGSYTDFWNNWVRDVFSLDTCNDFGASVWAIILGVTFTVQIEPNIDRPAFGFDPFGRNFFDGNFGQWQTQSIELNITQKRLLLKLRYFQLVSRGTIPEINKFLQYVFGSEGVVYVLDQYDMSFIVYVFTYSPPAQTLFVLNQYDVLPRPAGVGVSLQIVTRPVFGFDPYNRNFYDGNFGA